MSRRDLIEGLWPDVSPDQLRTRFRALRSRQDVANLLQVPHHDLIFWIYRRAPRYSEFSLVKRSGGERTIFAPDPILKALQRRLATVLDSVYRPRLGVHGFVADRSILSNGALHRGRRWVLNIDLADFFPSIHFGRVHGILRKYGALDPAAEMLAKICCHSGQLPQGAPTSPVVSNMVCSSFDRMMRGLAESHHCRYSRYADDITFSTARDAFPDAVAQLSYENRRPVVQIGRALETLIERHSFKVNEAKTRLRDATQHQEVTGLTVNHRLNVKRRYVRNVRAMLHAWHRHGYEAAEASFLARKASTTAEPQAGSFRRAVRGKLEFLRMVKGGDDSVFLNLWNRLAAIEPHRYRARVRSLSDIESALWVIEADYEIEGQLVYGHGTAFLLEGYGLVTAAHCVSAIRARLYRRTAPNERYQVVVRRMCGLRDLAILDVPPANSSAALRATTATQTVEVGDEIHTAGYADDTVAVTRQTGRVTRLQRRLTFPNIFSDFETRKGSSGSPLLNARLRAVGIVLYGPSRIRFQSDVDQPASSAIAIQELDHVAQHDRAVPLKAY